MILRILFIILALMMTTSIFAQTQPPIETGVSQTLAKWRSANYSDIRYKLNITLEKGAPLMKGDIEIRVNLTDAGAKNHLVLDWRTTQFLSDEDKPYADVVKVNESVVKETVPNGVFDYQTNKEHLIISKKYLKTGENVLQIKFASPIKTSGAAVTRYVDKEDGAEYVYSLFVPSDASTAFPVFDQPDLKARFQLNLTMPSDWLAVSNTDGSLNIDDKTIEAHTVKNKDKVTIKLPLEKVEIGFVETQPISTYVFAFAAGDFEVFNESDISKNLTQFREPRTQIRSKFAGENDPKASANIREIYNKQEGSQIYIRKSQAEKFKQHAAEVFRLNREGVKFLEDWFDYKFPFPKYDLVLIPEFPFRGMEHAGATFLREDSIIFPTEPTKNDYISRANVIFHEAAHQWFGDTVTMKWFDDLWLKEGFAEFMAYKTLEKVMPEYNAWKVFYERNKQAAYLTDSTRGTTPIYQEIPNLSSAKSAYGNIVYRKAPSFLRQAEFYLGEDKFQTAVRAFLKKHEFSNAEWSDLVKAFEKSSETDLKMWADVWVKDRGLFKVKIEQINFPKDQAYELKPTFEHSLGTNLKPVEKFKILVVMASGQKVVKDVIVPAKLKSGSNTTKPNWNEAFENWQHAELIFPNYQDYGYGIFLLDEKSRAYVLENIGAEKDDFLRSMMWGSLWDSVRFYELAPEDYVALVIKNLARSPAFTRQNAAENSNKNETRKVNEKPSKDGTQNFVETDESTIATLLNRVSIAMNYYLTDAQAEQFAPQIEKLLIEKINNAPTLGQKITFYRAFVSLASTENARNVLKELLKPKTKDQKPIFELKSKDKFDIVTKLITLGDADGLKLLSELEKTETDDAAKRYAYAARAGIPTAENKLKYWKDFTSNKEISESWIESAFAVWNTPRHAELTLPYLHKALAELPNLKRNRKIFFVNGWLSAFIGGQKSIEALNIVNKFLKDNPNLDADLQRKILENSDNLERAVKIRAKFEK